MKMKDNPEIRELIEKEWILMFQEDPDELRSQAKEKISQIQKENRTTYNKRRKEARKYKDGDLVAILRTQRGGKLKFHDEYYGPYRIIMVMRNDRYRVEKVGEHDGPMYTTSSADHMKPWVNENKEELLTTDDEDII